MAGQHYRSLHQGAFDQSTPGSVRQNSSADQISVSKDQTAPLIKFARYVDDALVLFEARTDALDYVAFSHVWGPTEWRPIRGVPFEVKCSKEKAHFIENDLPGMVGDGAFWMDTLTVNQRDPVEIWAVVDEIPTIFRMAKKTVAIRECDGLYSCCMSAVEGFKDHGDFSNKLLAHAESHYRYVCREAFLQRLWTLQECLLSHTIEFVVGNDNVPRSKRDDRDSDPYRHQNDLTTLSDSLWVLSHGFAGFDGESAMIHFVRAYVHGGTVINSRDPIRRHDEDIHTGLFLRANLASHRSAEMPRDYVFATMPAFPWYNYPRDRVTTMTFSEIYVDLYEQSSRTGHAFTCKFPRSMIQASGLIPSEAWSPNPSLPDPTTLGDFLKLVGNRVPEASHAESEHVHITSVVLAQELVSYVKPDSLIEILEKQIGPCQQQWQESHLGGELSRYGNFPRTEWELDYADALSNGWVQLDRRIAVRPIDLGDGTLVRVGSGLEYEENDLLSSLFSLGMAAPEPPIDELSERVPLFVQARRILDHMWCAHDPNMNNKAQKDDWKVFKREMRGLWTVPLLHTMYLLAGMVNCRIPLSAVAWINKLFVPIMIQYGQQESGKGFLTFGLLAKHARQPASRRHEPLSMLSVGQHLPRPAGSGEAFGKDLFLVDRKTKLPVGLIPDLMPDDRTDERWAVTACAVYYGRCQYQGNNEVAFAIEPLKLYSAAS